MEELYYNELENKIFNHERNLRVLTLSMLLLLIIVYAVNLFNIGMVSYYWPLALSLPFAITNIFAARRIPKAINNILKSIGFYISLIASLIFLFATIMMLLFSRFEKEDFRFIERIEAMIEFEFPNQGKIITKDFRESKVKQRYQTLSRVYFSIDINELENKIAYSDKWTNDITSDMRIAIPNYLVNNDANYYLLYNKDTMEYNTKPSPGKYNYLLIYYFQDGEVAIVEYQMEIIEGDTND